MRTKNFFYLILHIFFLSGLLYAFQHFLRTPRTSLLERRLWAYESWIILSFYSLFVYLTLNDKEFKLSSSQKITNFVTQFREVVLINLILLIFPWGLFLLLGPNELLILFQFKSIYWRILGGASLLGALIYYLPYRFYTKKFSYYIIIFGAIDNFLAGLILTILFILRKVPLVAWSGSPLLFYFSYFFFRQAKHYQKTVTASY